jgi:FeS assembly SUF system regulator
MLRLNKLTDYAVVLLARMALAPEAKVTAAQLASLTAVPEPTVAKILKELAKSGLIEATRGALGGYRLTRPGHAVTVRQVIEAIEGPIQMAECLDDGSTCCTTQKQCPLRGQWGPVNDAVTQALDGITLADMMAPPEEKKLYNIVIPAETGIQKTVKDSRFCGNDSRG